MDPDILQSKHYIKDSIDRSFGFLSQPFYHFWGIFQAGFH